MSATNRTYLHNFENDVATMRVHLDETTKNMFPALHDHSSYETNTVIANFISTYDIEMREIYAQDYIK